MWALEEYGFEYEMVRIDPTRGENRTESFLRMNPGGKIPVLLHEGRAYTESVAIMEYPDSVSDHLKLIPTESRAYYQYRRVMHFGATELEAYLWLSDQSGRLNSIYHWQDGVGENAMQLVKNNLELVYDWLESSSLVCGADFTLADIYYFHLMIWSKANGVTLASSANNYLERLQDRAAIPEAFKT